MQQAGEVSADWQSAQLGVGKWDRPGKTAS